MYLIFMNFFKFSLLLGISFFCNFSSLRAEDTQWGNDFFVLTIPKSGTHLLVKLLYMMNTNMQSKSELFTMSHIFPQLSWEHFPGDNEQAKVSMDDFEAAMLDFKNLQYCAIAHTNFSLLFKEFLKNHPEYIPVIQIRDLRDVLVSCVIFQWNWLEYELGPSTFDQKLLFLIQLRTQKTKTAILRLYRYAEEALSWMNHPNVVVCRFEDLVGEKGGGSRENQESQIVAIANKIGVSLSDEQLSLLISNLFGKDAAPEKVTWTFRKGEVGEWKQYFNAVHRKEFKRIWGNLQNGLGYSLDE